MPDENNAFATVSDRLKRSLSLVTDAQLGEALGFAAAAWNKRKTRGSLPAKEIAELIEREGLNPEFIWKGTGPVHVAIDGEAWADGFTKRLASALGLETYRSILISQGYKDKDLKAVASGKQEPPMGLLRDLHLHLGIDLNWLVCDEPAMSVQEKGLIQNYRRSGEDGQRLIDHTVVFAAKAGLK
jgi:hypothetical protein